MRLPERTGRAQEAWRTYRQGFADGVAMQRVLLSQLSAEV